MSARRPSVHGDLIRFEAKRLSLIFLQVSTPLTKERAVYVRDALAKAIYERLFMWLVNKINLSLLSQRKEKTTVLGLLDIYGFEIFGVNRYLERVCRVVNSNFPNQRNVSPVFLSTRENRVQHERRVTTDLSCTYQRLCALQLRAVYDKLLQ